MDRINRNLSDNADYLQNDDIPADEQMRFEDDTLAEEILENMNSTSLGQVLKKIAFLPEIRQKKILTVRQQICQGKYDVNERLDAVLEKVLEEI